MSRLALVLLSDGLDSTTAAAVAAIPRCGGRRGLPIGP